MYYARFVARMKQDSNNRSFLFTQFLVKNGRQYISIVMKAFIKVRLISNSHILFIPVHYVKLRRLFHSTMSIHNPNLDSNIICRWNTSIFQKFPKINVSNENPIIWIMVPSNYHYLNFNCSFDYLWNLQTKLIDS